MCQQELPDASNQLSLCIRLQHPAAALGQAQHGSAVFQTAEQEQLLPQPRSETLADTVCIPY